MLISKVEKAAAEAAAAAHGDLAAALGERRNCVREMQVTTPPPHPSPLSITLQSNSCAAALRTTRRAVPRAIRARRRILLGHGCKPENSLQGNPISQPIPTIPFLFFLTCALSLTRAPAHPARRSQPVDRSSFGGQVNC
jgi:hypothetical protein